METVWMIQTAPVSQGRRDRCWGRLSRSPERWPPRRLAGCECQPTAEVRLPAARAASVQMGQPPGRLRSTQCPDCAGQDEGGGEAPVSPGWLWLLAASSDPHCCLMSSPPSPAPRWPLCWPGRGVLGDREHHAPWSAQRPCLARGGLLAARYPGRHLRVSSAGNPSSLCSEPSRRGGGRKWWQCLGVPGRGPQTSRIPSEMGGPETRKCSGLLVCVRLHMACARVLSCALPMLPLF